jgi:hypothetical protein
MISAQRTRFRLQDETHGTSCLRQSAQCLRRVLFTTASGGAASLDDMPQHFLNPGSPQYHRLNGWGTFGQKNQGKRIVRVYKHKDAYKVWPKVIWPINEWNIKSWRKAICSKEWAPPFWAPPLPSKLHPRNFHTQNSRAFSRIIYNYI